MEKNAKLTRITMNLSNRSLDNVEELSKIIHETNKTRVVSSSLEIAKAILSRVTNGDKIIIKGKDGSEQELNFIIG